MMWFFVGRLSRWPAGSIGWPKPGFWVPRLPSTWFRFLSAGLLASLAPLFSPFSQIPFWLSFFERSRAVKLKETLLYVFKSRYWLHRQCIFFSLSETKLRKVCLFGKLRRIFFPETGKMDAGIEKECSALGGLFQLIMNDMKVKTN